jgi:hypothetical protein
MTKQQQSPLFITPHEYFKHEIASALSKKNLVLSSESEFYLVNLLCEFISPDRNICSNEVDVFNTPMALILKKALEAPPEKKLKLYKGLGDTSLYISGYFQDYFNRKSFDLSYFISMGSQAYESISSLVKNQQSDCDFTLLYKDLAANFPTLVAVINTISESTSSDSSNKTLLETYERWTKNNSETLREKLTDSGILPVVNLKKDPQ